jgi:MFS family permease
MTSLLTDVGSEMMVSLMPAFLALLPGGGTMALGLVEAVAESSSSLLKYAIGRQTDKVRSPKPWVAAGYILSALTKPFFPRASRVGDVILLRLLDRVGKGVRSAPRDTLLSASLTQENAGRGFGFHRAMDHLGAAIGPLLAFGLLSYGMSLRAVLLVAAVPALLAVIPIFFVPALSKPAAAADDRGAERLPAELKRVLAPMALFALANSSDVLLLLRLRELGIAAKTLPLFWCMLHISKAALSPLGGSLSDRMSRPVLLALSYALYAAHYAGFAWASTPFSFGLLLFTYGAVHALQEPTEKALIRDLASAHERGRAFGAYYIATGLLAFPATLGTSYVWEHQGAAWALGGCGFLATLACGWMMAVRRKKPILL